MGIKHIATSVELATNRTVFYGKDLNHVRGWYFWLGRRLGLKKAIDTIKKRSPHPLGFEAISHLIRTPKYTDI